VGAEPNRVLREGDAEQPLLPAIVEYRLGWPVGVNENDVRLGWLDIQAVDAVQPLRESLRAAVVLRESLAVFERFEAGGGNHPGLSHPAAEQLSDSASLLDDLLGPGENRADGRTQPLREAGHHRVDVFDEIRRLAALRGRGIEQPRPVEVD